MDKNELATPDLVVRNIERALGVTFDHDLFATDENTKCPAWYTKKDDALSRNWREIKKGKGNLWANPPYGRKGPGVPGLNAVVDKFRSELGNYSLAAVLVNQDSTTRWHRVLAEISNEVWRFTRRIKFTLPGIETSSAPRTQDLFIIRRTGIGPVIQRYFDPLEGREWVAMKSLEV